MDAGKLVQRTPVVPERLDANAVPKIAVSLPDFLKQGTLIEKVSDL